ncbi:uncharacterized protein SOCE836_093120 [Sorangium cellulosum]|uniref:Uncharacterized protein n=1 Tax=Sorangium cellulosum TaxID=56 RepID=A0A4V0NHL5_SORCE|nr:uncharacterized protein SOCE836_093120 [Sorangium cellulosum]WCQ96383.1 hypothetical protein NQZ70_09169 [Sorangium sp. Soce836]
MAVRFRRALQDNEAERMNDAIMWLGSGAISQGASWGNSRRLKACW